MEPEDERLCEKPEMKNLDGLTVEQLKTYCLDLNSSCAEYQKNFDWIKKRWNRKMEELRGEPRKGHHPAERIPFIGKWTCFHPKFAGKHKKQGSCGRSNPYYESRLLWKEVTHCKTCKGPYSDSFELLKEQISKKCNPRAKHKANETAAPVAHQFRENSVYDHHTSSSMQAAPLLDASSGRMHSRLGGDETNAKLLPQSWLSTVNGHHQNHSSMGSQSIPMRDSSSGINDSTACDYPEFGNSDFGFTDALHLNMDFNSQNEAYDEFAFDSDPLFMDEDMDLGSSVKYISHYPDRLNLFPQQVGPVSQEDALHQPNSVVGNFSYGSTSASAPHPNQPLGPGSNWAPIQFQQLHKLYKSPYGAFDSSAPIESATFDNGFLAGTLQSRPHPVGIAPLNSTAADPQNMQLSSLMSPPDDRVIKVGQAITIKDANYKAGASVVQSETLETMQWPSYTTRVKIPKVPKAESIGKPKGPGRGWAKLPESKPWVPPKNPRQSRSKAAKAEKAASKAGILKNPVLTESQIQRIHAQNKTSAIFLRKNVNSKGGPVKSRPPKLIIEISEDGVEVQENRQQEMQHDMDLGVDELTAALNAEFDRQACAEALKMPYEESDVSEEE
jgi:hypothetical protein